MQTTMKILDSTITFTVLIGSTSAFTLAGLSGRSVTTHKENVFMATLMDLPDTSTAKRDLIETAERLKEEYGIFLIDKTAKKELQDAVAELENLSELPAYHEYKSELLGEWELVCTTATSNDGIDTSKLPFAFEPLKQIRDSIRKTLNKYLKVEQVIKSTKEDETVIDRIDHVLQYEPPRELREVLDNLPAPLSALNINPLAVSKSKLILVHKAEIESETPLKIKLALKSIVLNVAGTSKFLDPAGQDITGINLPLGEFLNAGSFETTYMDKDLRISRGKLGLVTDQLRVFVRPGRLEKDAALKEILEDKSTAVGKGVDADLDVDESVDPEFKVDSPSDVED